MANAHLQSASHPGYVCKTIAFKSAAGSNIDLDVRYPRDDSALENQPCTVLMHYHGGFLVVGDRNTFYPHWLVNAATARGWIFVTPDYRLLPEVTAHEAVEDAVDAYEWVLSNMKQELGRDIGPVLVAGSSAGAYLALCVAASTHMRQPSALLLIYGMLDPTISRYTTPGSNIFNRPSIETHAILAELPKHTAGDTRNAISAYPMEDPATDSRFRLVSALHLDAMFLDYMTGVNDLGRLVHEHGIKAIHEQHKHLFPVAYGDLGHLPRTFLLHGRNDSAVPVENTLCAAEKLKASGVDVTLDLPNHAEHGFDARAGNIDIESSEGERVTAYKSLRNAVAFLTQCTT